MKVLLLCAKGFETMEFSVFVDVMGWARENLVPGVAIEVVTVGTQKTVATTFGVPVVMDRTLGEIDPDDYDALAIPGGFETYGFYEEAFSEPIAELIRSFDAAKKPIATICVAALALGYSGILKGRKATTYHLGGGRRQRQLAEFGADVQPDTAVVIDENVITSYCPETAVRVAFRLLEKLTDWETTKKVMANMGYAPEFL